MKISMEMDYAEAVKQLASDPKNIINNVKSDIVANLLHASMGICTESGELMDVLKKSLAYNKHLDLPNLVEELGDLIWYIQLACNTIGVDLETVMRINADKLKARYGDSMKFSSDKANNRNLDSELDAINKERLKTIQGALTPGYGLYQKPVNLDGK